MIRDKFSLNFQENLSTKQKRHLNYNTLSPGPHRMSFLSFIIWSGQWLLWRVVSSKWSNTWGSVVSSSFILPEVGTLNWVSENSSFYVEKLSYSLGQWAHHLAMHCASILSGHNQIPCLPCFWHSQIAVCFISLGHMACSRSSLCINCVWLWPMCVLTVCGCGSCMYKLCVAGARVHAPRLCLVTKLSPSSPSVTNQSSSLSFAQHKLQLKSCKRPVAYIPNNLRTFSGISW